MEQNIELTEQKGDLFDAPANAILVHACNCMGSWGAGIALAFKNKYPTAYNQYSTYCNGGSPDDMIGTSMCIKDLNDKNHVVACLFTSRKYGSMKDSKEDILDATKTSFKGLLTAIESDTELKNREIWMCKINSGFFGVPWDETKEVLESITVSVSSAPLIRVVSMT